jgi:hypothetical protein
MVQLGTQRKRLEDNFKWIIEQWFGTISSKPNGFNAG